MTHLRSSCPEQKKAQPLILFRPHFFLRPVRIEIITFRYLFATLVNLPLLNINTSPNKPHLQPQKGGQNPFSINQPIKSISTNGGDSASFPNQLDSLKW